MNVALRTSFGRRHTATFCLALSAVISSGCALIPTWDDIHSATATVTDSVTGKARRDRQNKTYAEARIVERRQDFATAERMYRELLTEKPNSRDCYHRLAVMAAMQGKYDDAKNLYHTALQCGPPSADVWSDLGFCHYLQHQLPEAEGALQQALKLEPQHRAALNNLAMVVGEAGRLDEAYALFRQGNDEAEAEANFAFVCAQRGDFERAQFHYSRALSVNPEMRVATEALLQVTQRMQMQLDHQSQKQVADAEAGADGQVQPAAYADPHQQPARRPLIEVYTAAPPLRPSLPADRNTSAGTVSAVMAAQAAGPMPTPGSRSYYDPAVAQTSANAVAPQPPGMPSAPSATQPQPVGQIPGTMNQAPQPYSFGQPSQPQYLQPTVSPRTSQTTLGSGGAAPADPSPVLNAGGRYPPLVGGASAFR